MHGSVMKTSTNVILWYIPLFKDGAVSNDLSHTHTKALSKPLNDIIQTSNSLAEYHSLLSVKNLM